MMKYLCVLVLLLANVHVKAQISLSAGVYSNGATYTLRWATNDQTLSINPRVVGVGSSTLAGYLLSYPDRLGDKISGWLTTNTTKPVWINLAVGGYASSHIMPTIEGGEAGKNIDSALNSNPDFIFISLPTNDIANGLTNQKILSNFRRLDSISLSHGVPIFWETTQPRNTFTAAQQTQLKQLADSIRSIWPQRYVEGFTNTTDLTAKTDAQIKPEYSAGDGIHLNAIGNQQIADSLYARWKRYFQPITGVTAYIIEITGDGKTWSQLDYITDASVVKKTYKFTLPRFQSFRVRALYTDKTYSAYSNTVTAYNADLTACDTIPFPAVSIVSGATSGCIGQSFTFTATGTDGTIYQWLVNGIAAGTDSKSFTTAQLSDGAQVQVLLTSRTACGDKTAASNTITMQLNNIVTPAVTISGNVITFPDVKSTTLKAVAVNPGTNLIYQWMDSTAAHTWQNITSETSSAPISATDSIISYSPLRTGDKIRCQLTSNATCAGISTVYSNTLSFTVQLVTAVNPDPVAQYGIRFFPNPVTDNITIQPLLLSDHWTTLDIRGMDGKRFLTQQIKNKTSVTVPVTHLGSGTYVLILRKNDGKAATIKFVKQ